MKFSFFSDLYRYRELLYVLTVREIKARYKQSILGYAWVVLVPLLNLVVMTVVFSYLVRINTGTIPYPVYLFTGLVPWTFLNAAITAGTGSLISNASLITKIKLPRAVFPVSSILVKLVDLALSTVILGLLLLLFGISVGSMVFWVPFIFGVQLMMVVGVVLFLSAVNVYFRDIENILGVLMMVWMYLTPVIYPPELIPDRFVPLFNLNPMMGIINAYRNVILHNVPPPLESFGYAIVISGVLFLGGYAFFKKASRYFADVI